MRPSVQSLLSATLLVGLTATTACSQQHAQEKRTPDAFAWRGAVPANGTVRIFNLNGPVTVSRSTDSTVRISAEKRWSGRRDRSRIERVTTARGDVTVCALPRTASCDPLDGIRKRSSFDWFSVNKVRVSFTVTVPDNVSVQLHSVNGAVTVRDIGSHVLAETVNGSVTVRNVAGNISAETVNGSITAESRGGRINAETVNGSINASLGAFGADGLEFSTVNGSVTLTLPDSMNAALNVSTVNGKITSDLPIMLRGEISRRKLRGVIGDGGPEIRVSTVNGGVTLKR
jgi:hypothetical protein